MLVQLLFAIAIVLPGLLTIVHITRGIKNPEAWLLGMTPMDSNKVTLFFNGEINLGPKATRRYWQLLTGASLIAPFINLCTYQDGTSEALLLSLFMLVPGFIAAVVTLQARSGVGFDQDEMEELMDGVGRKVMENRSLPTVQSFLKGISSVRDRRYYPVVFDLLVDWGGPSTLDNLGYMQQRLAGRERKTKMDRRVENQMRSLQSLYGKQAKEPDLPTVRKLLETGYWKRVFQDFDLVVQRESATPTKVLLGGGGNKVLASLQYQVELQRAFPHLFCTHCHSRAKQVDLEGWTVVKCTRCDSVEHLKMGVQSVTGVIGPMGETPNSHGLMQVPLWNASDAKAIPADIDHLAIRSGGIFDYDWAVSGVVESLRNRHPDKTLSIPVTLSSAVSLRPNTHSLLNSIRKT